MLRFLPCLIIALLLQISAPAPADASAFTVERFVTCKRVSGLKPMEITDTFKATTKKVYAFIEAKDIAEDTAIKIQWLYNDKEAALIELTLPKGARWRTYSSKRIGVRHGVWEVRLLDKDDKLLQSLTFTVK